MTSRPDSAPPGFLRLAGHPLRWRLLDELARSDRQVRELTDLIGQPQSLVSYHLGRLRASSSSSRQRSGCPASRRNPGGALSGRDVTRPRYIKPD